MTPPPLEHDYIGLTPTKEAPEKVQAEEEERKLGFKETELRLGLPGSESPERNKGMVKSLVSGAKRGFSDTIDGVGKWGLGGGVGSEVEVGKGSGLYSPRGEGGVGSGSGGKDAGGVVGEGKKVQNGGKDADRGIAPAPKAQVVGWPPIRNYRKNTMATTPSKNKDEAEVKQGAGCLYVKVSMDGAPYLRKVDLKTYCNYKELSSALEKMFSCFTIGQCSTNGIPGRDGLSESRLTDLLNGSEYVLTYEDKDGDWMLVGDVPWE
ncbi:AUX/IAA protein [Dioscorea alata]|nr:AUX/IAA protein [Dioscorea alata]